MIIRATFQWEQDEVPTADELHYLVDDLVLGMGVPVTVTVTCDGDDVNL